MTETNGDWDNATGDTFTAAAGTPFSGVSAGEFASVYLDAAGVGVFVSRITAVGGGGASITLSTTARSGTKPSAGASGRSCKVGGAWKGPNGSEGFPFGFADGDMTNTDGDYLRINVKGGTNYDITAALVHDINGFFLRFEGYTTTIGDGGKATVDGGTSGASYILLSLTGHGSSPWNGASVHDMIFQNNGATGNANGVSILSQFGGRDFVNVVVNNVRGNGFNISNGNQAIGCEAYGTNQSNTSDFGGFSVSSSFAIFHRCISHSNLGSNSAGFVNLGGNNTLSSYSGCIAHLNGGKGFNIKMSLSNIFISGCDSYDNTGDGFNVANRDNNRGKCHIENCNSVKNGGYGLNTPQTTNRIIANNIGFGAGTMANSSGQIVSPQTTNLEISGTVTYADDVTPWTDPDDGDFTINLAAAKNAGIGEYTQTKSGYGDPNPTIGFPDIGAAQHQDAGGGDTIAGSRTINSFHSSVFS